MPENRTPGLHIRHSKGDIVENTVGRIGGVESDIMLWTPGSIVKNPGKETVEYLKDKYKDVPWKGNVEVYLGHSPLFRQLKRLFQKDRRTNLFARFWFGIPQTIGGWIAGKLARTDMYNPWTETVQVYNAHKAVAMHEVGHAEDFDQARHPTLKAIARSLPTIFAYPIAIIQEWNASRNAMKHLQPDERQNAAKVLTPAFGTYLGANLPILNWIPLIAGHIHARLSKNTPFLHPILPERKPVVAF